MAGSSIKVAWNRLHFFDRKVTYVLAKRHAIRQAWGFVEKHFLTNSIILLVFSHSRPGKHEIILSQKINRLLRQSWKDQTRAKKKTPKTHNLWAKDTEGPRRTSCMQILEHQLRGASSNSGAVNAAWSVLAGAKALCKVFDYKAYAVQRLHGTRLP